MRVPIHVRPGARSAGVGGCHAGALVVRVRERAEGGRATEAALAALAGALGLPRREVTLVAGAASRSKLVDLPESVAARIATLLGGQQP